MAQAWGDPNRVVSILLEHGASANSADNSGFTVLMMACGRNNQNILDQLIRYGADVHARSSDSSPLHEAAGCNFHEGIITLLALGANPDLVDGRGRTPKQLAEVCGFEEAAKVLRAARSTT
jgi:ankyrin repeat protein